MAAVPPFIEMTFESDIDGVSFRFETVPVNIEEGIWRNLFTLDISRHAIPTRDTLSVTEQVKHFAFLINGPGADQRGQYLEKSTISLHNDFNHRFEIVLYRMANGTFPLIFKKQDPIVDDAETHFHTFITAAQYTDIKEQIDAFVADHPVYVVDGPLNAPPVMPPAPPAAPGLNNANSNNSNNSNSNNNAIEPNAIPPNNAEPALNPGSAYHVYDRAPPGAHRGYGTFRVIQSPAGVQEARFEPFTTDDNHEFESQTFTLATHRFVPMAAVSGGRRRKTQRRRHRRRNTRRRRISRRH